MAIFHANASVISRAAGHSSVAAVAYDARARMRDDRTGELHDHRHTHSHEFVVADLGITLPDGPHPDRWDADPSGDPARRATIRAGFWSELEAVEKGDKACVGWKFEFALPRELDRTAQLALARTIVSDFRDAGFTVDAVVHDVADGSNPHAHLVLTDRRVTADGWGTKCENIYLARAVDGRERWVNAPAFKALQQTDPDAEWSKVFKYRRGNERRQMTPTEALSWEGCKKASRAPVQATRYFSPWHENRVSPAWLASYHKSDEGEIDHSAAVVWRATVAVRTNEALEAAGEAARVSHLSYADQGIDRIPTRHLGPRTAAVERQAQREAEATGRAYEPVTDRASINAEITTVNRAMDLARRIDALEARRQAAPQPRPRQAVPQPQPMQTDALRPRRIADRPAVMRSVLAKAAREGRTPDRRGAGILARWLRQHTRTSLGGILAGARLRMDTPAEAVMDIARAVAATVIAAVISRTQRKSRAVLGAGRRAATAWHEANPATVVAGSRSCSRSSGSSPGGYSTPAHTRSREVAR